MWNGCCAQSEPLPCRADPPAWFLLMSTSHSQPSVGPRQTGVARGLHISDFLWRRCSPRVCLLSQGLDDQPGVQPQRLLPAQRRHRLLQPLPVQLHDLQVETGGPAPPPPSLLTPSTRTPAFLHLWTLFTSHNHSCLHKRRKSWKAKMMNSYKSKG